MKSSVSASVASPIPDASRPDGTVSRELADRIADHIARQGGWIGFERFMELALYAPGLGYYTRGARQFGLMPSSGSDFVTGPEITPLFGAALARQVEEALTQTATDEVWEFGAGSGALAAQMLHALGPRIAGYTIVDLSPALRERQRETLAARVPQWAHKVRWVDALPPRMHGVVVGNEVLDAMPVMLLHYDGQQWLERGVAMADNRFVWADVDTTARPPVDSAFVPGTVTEWGRQAEGFIRTIAATLERGAAFFIDYGFPQAEYYHPQRIGGTLMCHRRHQADTDPLTDVGDKDITSHVDFSAVALAGQEGGLVVLGYASQASFLLNCGLLNLVAQSPAREAAMAQKLLSEHEMGELFKVIGFVAGAPEFDAIGFTDGDRSHRL